MTRHHFEPTAFHNVLGWLEPVLHIADGDSVVTTTLDAHGRDAANVERALPPNPMTGPFFIDGVEPGDVLLVVIDRMTPTRESGWTLSALASNVVDPTAVPMLPDGRRKIFWSLDHKAQTVRLADGPRGLENFVLPLAPMIGCFGVAPALGQALSTATSSANGGNMDYRRFGPGAVAAFPVFAPGALFFLGDGHACQGDGEIVGAGIETSFEIEFTVRIRKGWDVRWPRAETSADIITLGNARPLDQALQHATTEMWRWLMSDFHLSAEAAGQLLGQVIRYDIGNVFNPAYTVACRVSKNWLERPERGWLLER